ncbi:hypothetical protein OQA88_9954 [Cercophora sp. LCS_1]
MHINLCLLSTRTSSALSTQLISSIIFKAQLYTPSFNTSNMKASTSIINAIAMALTGASMVNATVFLALRKNADGNEAQVAYTNGTPDPCSGFTTIVNSNSNPCGIDFFVDGNNGPFTFENCGDNNFHLERNHQFNSNCVFQSNNKINCPGNIVIGVSGTWKC